MATETLNAPDLYKFCEIIGGKKFRLPSMTPAQSQMQWRIITAIMNYFMEHKNGYVFGNVDVYFDDENIFVPGAVVVLKEHEQILAQRDIVHGAPDMVVEVLSYSTRKKDLTVKKDTYEAQGVREYWIIDPWAKIVDVYLLRDGKYFLSGEYMLPDEKDLEFMTDAERAEVKSEVPVSIVDGLTIPLEFVFSWGY